MIHFCKQDFSDSKVKIRRIISNDAEPPEKYKSVCFVPKERNGAYNMADAEKILIKRAKFPEEVGVSSHAVANFIADLNKNKIEAHSLMILRHGKVAFECWREPYGPEFPHIMFSVSKSVTSAAVGFAIEEGLLTLETRVIDFFPEYVPAVPDKNLEKLNIYHLLTMTAGKDVPTLSDKSKDQWIKDFFDAKWAFAPGEFWRYISENTFILCVILTKVTGMPVTDYLMPRLFEPLGFGRRPFWEKDGNGIEAGGWGLYLTTEELAKFTLCCSQGGKFNGKQVIPEKWVKEATKKQVENLQYTELASTSGYGYGFWRNPVPDSYRSDGLFSQFGMVFEKYDACFIMTASEIFEEKARDCIWRHFPGIFCGEIKEPPADAVPKEKLELAAIADLPANPHSRLEKTIEGKILKIKKNLFLEKIKMPVGMLPSPVLQMNIEKLGNIKEVRFLFRENECEMTWREGLYKNTILCGMDGKPRRSRIKMSQFSFTASSSAAWENENSLCVWMRPLEAVGQRQMKFVFSGGKVSIYPSSQPDAKSEMEYIAGFVDFFVKPEPVVKAAKIILSKADKVIEPRHTGKIK